ncbi:deoxyribonuclease IV [Streptoalloteichus hindustanus]|uniref:Endonuclease IV n=1 Tax=Streptoalloteichus hindustanus TaxID=2017 RepID=A0A1M4UXX9_STRHI|nr:deoxyribonuclease IV [Streptoalloteichus hindustanus]SHE61528.1 Endonuclease IV [Streptoalloteichus hindustanus]
MRIGAHVGVDDPLGAAEQRGAEVVQFFLSNPQSWTAAQPHPQSEALRAADIEIFVHAPYVVNVASLNNRVRIPSRKAVVQQAGVAAQVGASGLIVHGGHVTKGDDPTEGVANWRKLFERQADAGGFPVPILIENTAGGDNAMARRFDMLARLWDAVGEFDAGFCLDTCHAHAAGEELLGIVDRVKAITGRIDLVHLNDSRDDFGSSRDRHANIGAGTIEPDLLVAVVAAAGAPVVVETPGEGQTEDITFLREKLGG